MTQGSGDGKRIGGPDLAPLVAPAFVLMWSTGFIGARLGMPYIEPLTFLAIRFWLVVGCIAVWVWASRAPWLSWRQAGEAAVIGVLLHGVYLGGVYVALSLGIEAGMSALIVGLQPILTALIARQVMGERLVGLQWLGMALGVAGVALVVARKLGDGIGDWRGVAFCVGSLVAIAVASILQKTRAQGHPMRSATLIQFAAAAAAVTPFALLLETGEIRWTGELVFAMAWLVVVLSLGAITLLYVLIRRGAASNVASLFFLVPACTALIAWAWFGEELGPVELAGVAVTALGVTMVHHPGLFRRRKAV